MTTEPATKRCPFCAEDIRAEAIKCRFCGEMLDAASSTSRTRTPTYETKVFVIPFPDGSPPTQQPIKNHSSNPFPDSFRRAMGWKANYYWADGATKLWNHYKDYFLRRINELGQEGWELAEPFEQARDEFGRLVRVNDRFANQEVEVPAFLGNVTRLRLTGARFLMRRANFG